MWIRSLPKASIVTILLLTRGIIELGIKDASEPSLKILHADDVIGRVFPHETLGNSAHHFNVSTTARIITKQDTL